MEKRNHIQLAKGVIKDGVPFHAKGMFGLKKGSVTVRLNNDKIQLVCGDLMPVDLVPTGNPKDDEALRSIEQAIEEARSFWSEDQ